MKSSYSTMKSSLAEEINQGVFSKYVQNTTYRSSWGNERCLREVLKLRISTLYFSRPRLWEQSSSSVRNWGAVTNALKVESQVWLLKSSPSQMYSPSWQIPTHQQAWETHGDQSKLSKLIIIKRPSSKSTTSAQHSVFLGRRLFWEL